MARKPTAKSAKQKRAERTPRPTESRKEPSPDAATPRPEQTVPANKDDEPEPAEASGAKRSGAEAQMMSLSAAEESGTLPEADRRVDATPDAEDVVAQSPPERSVPRTQTPLERDRARDRAAHVPR